MVCKEKIFALTVLIAFTFLSCGSEEAGGGDAVVNQKPPASASVKTEAGGETGTAETISVKEEDEKKQRPELLEIYVEASDEEGGSIFGGNSKREKDGVTSSVRREEKTDLAAKGSEPAKPTKHKPKPKPKGGAIMSFHGKSHKYGMIMQGDKIEHDFKFTNKGTRELVVNNVDASCGCTQPSFPFIPIPPGETGVIGVVFDSTGKLGPQKSTVTIYTNAGTHKIYLEGFVDAEREKPKETKMEETKGEAPEKEENEKGR